MLIRNENPWENTTKSALVSVGNYSLHVKTFGPPRKAGAPVAIFITGGGAPIEVYAHFQKALGKTSRCYFFDREGYGRSTRRPQSEHRAHHDANELGAFRQDGEANEHQDASGEGKIYATSSAVELHTLLRRIHVRPPYVLAAHSYGGIIARAYLALYPSDVAGMALLDTGCEMLYQAFSPIPPPEFERVVKDVDYEELTHLREESNLSDEEWNVAIEAVLASKDAADAEDNSRSSRQLARERQLDLQAMGDKPLLVMRSDMPRGFRVWFDEALKSRGDWSKEDELKADDWLEGFELLADQVSRTQLRLSKNVVFEHWDDVTHDFPLRKPERTAEAVMKVLRMVEERWKKKLTAGIES